MRYGRYQIVKILGKGSMGEVYEAYDPSIAQPVALKVLRRDRVSNEAFSRRFLNEAKGAGRLRSHPNIVTVYDVGEDQGTVYIAMELLQGKPLNEVARDRRLDLQEIARIGVQIGDALQYAHEQGIVHRDIKPSNLILEPGGTVKITDFGIAHIEDDVDLEQTQVGEILGTPAYMSPEQTRGRAADRRSDIFSLGVVLYELATATRPFAGASMDAIFDAIQDRSPASPDKLNPSLPKDFSRAVLKCLEKDPNKRFQTARDLSLALASFTQPAPVTPPARRSGSRFGFIPKIAAIIALLLIAVTGYLVYDHISKRNRAHLTISSQPNTAEVFVNNRSVGKTPIDIRLKIGKSEIRVSKEGYYSWEAQVHLTDTVEYPLQIELLPSSSQIGEKQ